MGFDLFKAVGKAVSDGTQAVGTAVTNVTHPLGQAAKAVAHGDVKEAAHQLGQAGKGAAEAAGATVGALAFDPGLGKETADAFVGALKDPTQIPGDVIAYSPIGLSAQYAADIVSGGAEVLGDHDLAQGIQKGRKQVVGELQSHPVDSTLVIAGATLAATGIGTVAGVGLLGKASTDLTLHTIEDSTSPASSSASSAPIGARPSPAQVQQPTVKQPAKKKGILARFVAWIEKEL